MCGWPQNKLKYLLHGIRFKGWPAWELDLFFNTRAHSKNYGRGDVQVGLDTAKIMGLWKEKSITSYLEPKQKEVFHFGLLKS